MKNLFIYVSIIFAAATGNSQQLSIPKPSPHQTIKQEFAIGSIEVSYSRPGLKERKIGGDFVPYGEIWRTGANSPTTITFSDEVYFGSAKVSKGTYGLLTIPGKNEWVIILTSDLNVILPNQYNKEHDIARFTAAVKQQKAPVETFTLNFAKFTINSCVLEISWDTSSLEVPIVTDIDTKIEKQIKNIFDNDKKPYYEAAQYYYDSGKDIKQAALWIEKATADEQNANMLHMFWLKSLIYQKTGEKAKAKESASLLIEKALKMGNQDYVTKSRNLIKDL